MRSIIHTLKSQRRATTSILLNACIASLTIHPAVASELNFTIKGVEQDSGTLYVALYKGAGNYDNNLPYRAQRVDASKSQLDVSFSRLPQGEYAIRYFHDQNGNQKMDKNLFGMPLEGFGYSNDAKPNMGPASYQQMKFEIPETGEVSNHSQVIYP